MVQVIVSSVKRCIRHIASTTSQCSIQYNLKHYCGTRPKFRVEVSWGKIEPKVPTCKAPWKLEKRKSCVLWTCRSNYSANNCSIARENPVFVLTKNPKLSFICGFSHKKANQITFKIHHKRVFGVVNTWTCSTRFGQLRRSFRYLQTQNKPHPKKSKKYA